MKSLPPTPETFALIADAGDRLLRDLDRLTDADAAAPSASTAGAAPTYSATSAPRSTPSSGCCTGPVPAPRHLSTPTGAPVTPRSRTAPGSPRPPSSSGCAAPRTAS